MTPLDLLDRTLVILLVTGGWLALTTSDLLRSVVTFIAFGLLVALAWVRMGAPDVAMAEAAVGSGLTGALLLSTLRAMRREQAERDARAEAGEDVEKEAEVA